MRLKVYLNDKETNNPMLVLFVKDLIKYDLLKSRMEEVAKRLKVKYSISPGECALESLTCEAHLFSDKDKLVVVVIYKLMNSYKSIEEVLYKEEYPLSNNLTWQIIKNILEIKKKTELIDIEKL